MTLEEQIAQNIFDKYERKGIEEPYTYVGRKKYDVPMESTDLVEYRNVLTMDTPALTVEELTLFKKYEEETAQEYELLDSGKKAPEEVDKKLKELNTDLNTKLNLLNKGRFHE